MKKHDEQIDPASCLNKAKENEPIFVLLGRDVSAPVAIQCWVASRIRMGKNEPGDAQLEEAKRLAASMEEWRANNAS